MRLVPTALLFFASLFAVAAAPAAAPPDAAALATLVRDHAAQTGFSGVVRVHRGDTVLFEEAFGLADRRWNAPVALDTRFRIASITKLFTAALVLQQVEAGTLALDATIGTYLPDYAGPARDEVTLRQLLSHTSGIANSDQVASFEQALADGVPPYQRPATTLQQVQRHASGELIADPGTKFDYNNADYFVLGAILEQVTGKAYAALVQEHIAGPLHLEHTAMPDWQAITPAIATSYLHLGDGQYINELPVYYENWQAAGALVSTADDVAAFSDALYGGKLISRESLATLLTPVRDEYGFGLWVSPVTVSGKPDRVAHRPGSIMGSNTQLLRYVDDGLTIVILANSNAADLDEFAFLVGNALTK